MQHKEDVFHLCVNYCFKKSLEKYSVWFLFCLCSRGILCTLAYLLASGLCMIKLKSGQCPSAELSKLFSICGASHIRCICFCSLSLSVRFWISPWFFSSRLLSLVKVNCCPHHLPGGGFMSCTRVETPLPVTQTDTCRETKKMNTNSKTDGCLFVWHLEEAGNKGRIEAFKERPPQQH